MSAAEKYGSAESFKLSPAQAEQVKGAGQTMADSGVKQDAPASESAAVKYAAPANNHHAKALSRERSL